MPVNVADVSNQYQDAIDQLRDILQNPDINDQQRSAAQLAIQDIYVQLGTHAIQTVQGRTALLSGLIAELTAVSDSIKLNPIGGAIVKLNVLISSGRKLYDESKQDLAT